MVPRGSLGRGVGTPLGSALARAGWPLEGAPKEEWEFHVAARLAGVGQLPKEEREYCLVCR